MADIVTTATQAGNFTTLIAALHTAGLTDLLKGPGPFTVFAPSDAAFHKLPQGLLDNLLNNPTQLREILSYHVVASTLTSDDIKDNDIRSVPSVQGNSLNLDASLLGVLTVNGASVTTADIRADNGVIHVIDQVLLPGGAEQRRVA